MYEMLKQQAEEECGHSTVIQDDGEKKWAGKLFAVVLFFCFYCDLSRRYNERSSRFAVAH